ncbi:MAG: response regulator [Candidatus Omnitrophica bacterium]|nr:response regulator [Candidatus Omnitrophota bacterium]MCM8798060.1 response regulator [Candidatus Omnitrophota bacterium]
MAKKKLLLIDDEQDVLRILKFRLEKAGYEVITALDGIKGLELAVHEKPDLIILDIMMPGGDGYSLCERLKNISTTTTIPVIFLSAKTEPKDITKGYASGAIYYITKPYDAEVLLSVVKKALAGTQDWEKEIKKGFKKLLLFTQDSLLEDIVRDNLSNLFEITSLNNIDELKALPPLNNFDIFILDLAIPGFDFKKFLQENRTNFPERARFILITDSSPLEAEEITSLISQPCVFLRRPFEVDELLFNLHS